MRFSKGAPVIYAHAARAHLWLQQLAVALVLAVSPAAAAVAGEPPIPASLISQRLSMVQGRPCVPLADLARAMGGSLRALPPAGGGGTNTGDFDIVPGGSGLLAYNPGAVLPPLQPESPRGSGTARPRGLRIGGRLVASQTIATGREPCMLLDEVARLLGGTLAFDPARGQWAINQGAAAARAVLTLRRPLPR